MLLCALWLCGSVWTRQHGNTATRTAEGTRRHCGTRDTMLYNLLCCRCWCCCYIVECRHGRQNVGSGLDSSSFVFNREDAKYIYRFLGFLLAAAVSLCSAAWRQHAPCSAAAAVACFSPPHFWSSTVHRPSNPRLSTV